jgi:hypothetical protein
MWFAHFLNTGLSENKTSSQKVVDKRYFVLAAYNLNYDYKFQINNKFFQQIAVDDLTKTVAITLTPI